MYKKESKKKKNNSIKYCNINNYLKYKILNIQSKAETGRVSKKQYDTSKLIARNLHHIQPHRYTEIKVWKKYHEKIYRKIEVALLLSDGLYFRVKMITTDKVGNA